MAKILRHPAMKPTTASIPLLRRLCDFRTVSYHYREGSPEDVCLFWPKHPGFYDQWLHTAQFDKALSAGGKVVGFRPRSPLLRVRYNTGGWEIIALLPSGHRVTVLTGIPIRPWIGAALAEMRQRLFDETGVWFRTSGEDWAIR